MSHRETNPHFHRPLRPQHHAGNEQPRDSLVPTPPPPPPTPEPQLAPELEDPRRRRSSPYKPSRPPRGVNIDDQRPPSRKPHAPSPAAPPRAADDKPRVYRPIPPAPAPVPRPATSPPRPPPPSLLAEPPASKASPPTVPPDRLGVPSPIPPLVPHGHGHGPPPRHHPRRHHDHHHSRFRVPTQKKTKPHTWLFAVFCVIFWLVIILGGLIVLIVYLVFRPQSPHFEVSSATLNAAYLDLGYLLNADVTVLANFTNPNKKVHVDFSSMIIYLYYGSTLVATQYVEPFSAAKAESKFANIHMVTSQVQLPMAETQRLIKQMESNGVIFEVKGVFRARSKLGSILRYSYNLYGYCSIMVTRPPGGVLIKRKCRTKR